MENNNDFLPTGYEQPKSGGNYMKLQKGENKFRILSKPIIGWEDWDDKKPLRFKMNEKPLKSIDPSRKIKHFWAFFVWNYSTEKVEVLQITQAGIQSAIAGFSKDADWGNPFGYDIKVIRTGEGMETEYQVNPVPHKPISAKVKEEFESNPLNLDALFTGGDPFDAPKKTNDGKDLPAGF